MSTFLAFLLGFGTPIAIIISYVYCQIKKQKHYKEKHEMRHLQGRNKKAQNKILQQTIMQEKSKEDSKSSMV